MQITLMPELTEAQKRSLSEWIAPTLGSPELAVRSAMFPLSGQLGLYLDGQLRVLHRNSSWQLADGVIYIGYEQRVHPMPLIERLAVVGGVISLAGLWETHHEQYVEVASLVLISSYQGVMSGMIQTEAAVSALAFNADRSVVAARIGDCYHLPTGELVEIDDTWTVVGDRPALRAVA